MKASKVLSKRLWYDHKVNKICIDSRFVEENDIFVAIKGNKQDGNSFIVEAIHKGAKTIITENKEISIAGINVIVVKDIYKFLGLMCKRFYGDLSSKIKLIGITGTNGKTSTATLIYKYFRFNNINITLLSTNGNYVNDSYYETNNTTPNIIEIYEMLKKALNSKCKYVVMEVSSHAIYLNRIYGLTYYIGALTNLTHDHLDFHKSLENYHYTKIIFMSKCKYQVISDENVKYAPFMNDKLIVYGKNNVDIQLIKVDESIDETKFDLFIDRIYHFNTKLLAEYNLYNIMILVAVLKILDCFNYDILKAFLIMNIQIPGRMEIINYNPKIIVDFAHTPDAIFKVLSFVNKHKSESSKIITVIGMGGERDKLKRKEVGKITSELSNFNIYTADNSRSEDTSVIIDNIISGTINTNYIKIIDRYEAIKYAIENAEVNDIVLILGRGAEKYLIIGNENIPFDDRDITYRIIQEIKR